MEKLNDIIFYSLEKCIKSYRQFAQKNISASGFSITIDQWLVLKTIQEDPSLNQQQIALKVFKDFASITRMIELLVKNGFLTRSFHKEDRRRSELTLSEEGHRIIEALEPIINRNRAAALDGLSAEDVRNLQALLSRITANLNQR